jgi:predicted metal-binding protein
MEKALAAGFTHAVWLEELKLKCEPRFREYCSPNGCRNHGSNWVCPPGCGSLEECAEKVSGYDRGILLQSVSETKPDFNDYAGLSRKHNKRLRYFIESYYNEGMEILALTSGGCIFCETCAYPEPCIKPDVRMNSLSAYGINVGKLCENAGLAYAFKQDIVYYTALLLIK